MSFLAQKLFEFSQKYDTGVSIDPSSPGQIKLESDEFCIIISFIVSAAWIRKRYVKGSLSLDLLGKSTSRITKKTCFQFYHLTWIDLISYALNSRFLFYWILVFGTPYSLSRLYSEDRNWVFATNSNVLIPKSFDLMVLIFDFSIFRIEIS